MVIDWVSRTAYDTPLGIKWTLQSCLEDLDFADDICQLSHRHQDSQKQASNLETTAKKVGLYINPSKTKSMRINANNANKTKIRGAELEDVTQFTYLGSVISTTGGTDEDIQARKRKAQQAFAILKPIWRNKSLRTATKIRIFNSNVKSVLLYGSETWRITAASMKVIQVFLNRCLRNIIGIKWPIKISNQNLWQRTKQEPVTRTITTRKWRWVGHTLRKQNTNVTRHALDWNPQGQRKRGRPKNTWRRDLASEAQKIGKTWGEIKTLSKDRKKWKTAVVALCPPWDEVD